MTRELHLAEMGVGLVERLARRRRTAAGRFHIGLRHMQAAVAEFGDQPHVGVGVDAHAGVDAGDVGLRAEGEFAGERHGVFVDHQAQLDDAAAVALGHVNDHLHRRQRRVLGARRRFERDEGVVLGDRRRLEQLRLQLRPGIGSRRPQRRPSSDKSGEAFDRKIMSSGIPFEFSIGGGGVARIVNIEQPPLVALRGAGAGRRARACPRPSRAPLYVAWLSVSK